VYIVPFGVGGEGGRDPEPPGREGPEIYKHDYFIYDPKQILPKYKVKAQFTFENQFEEESIFNLIDLN